MRHKYLPRFATSVLALGCGLALGAVAGCRDSTGPPTSGPRLLVAFESPAGDALAQLGVGATVTRSDSALMRTVLISVDSGAAHSTAGGLLPGRPFLSPSGPASVWTGVVALPGVGRHTITVVAVDTVGHTLTTSAAWTVRLASEAYTATALPDSGHGAGTRFVHATGTVTGWIGGSAGRRRPAVWRRGALAVVGAIDSVDGAATRVNAAGDVLLEYGASVRVLRTDGTTVAVPSTTYTYPTESGGTYSYQVCCNVGADLTDTRFAVGTTLQFQPYGYASSVLDVARGVGVDSALGQIVALNDAGQSVETVTDALIVALNDAGQSVETVTDAFSLYMSTYLVPHGFKVGAFPERDLPVAPVDQPHHTGAGHRRRVADRLAGGGERVGPDRGARRRPHDGPRRRVAPHAGRGPVGASSPATPSPRTPGRTSRCAARPPRSARTRA
ncbi:MAG TPA: hypothetical protein VGD56_11475 [Gemmatirosa sp.]